MGKAKSKDRPKHQATEQPAQPAKEITPEMKAISYGPRFRKRCPECNRPEDDPATYSRTDRLLSTVFTNPVLAFMRMHNYAGPGGILELSDRFLRFLDRAQPLSRRQAELLVEVLTEYAHGPHRRVAPLVVAVVFEDMSYRAAAAEFGVSDHTIAVMVSHARPALDQLCRDAGVFSMSEN
jgi:hypothetical protein